jgi:hypothetical protein
MTPDSPQQLQAVDLQNTFGQLLANTAQDSNSSALAILLLLLAGGSTRPAAELSTADAPQQHAYTAHTTAEHLDTTSSTMMSPLLL